MRIIKNTVLWGIFSVSTLVFIIQAWTLLQIHNENAWINRLLSGHDIAIEKVVKASPEVRLARAVYLREKGRYDEALATLNLILDQGSPSLQAKTRYNLGNLYLTQTVERAEKMAINDALPLAALAKQAYRQALALDSQFWDAKYNLEVAMRIAPEMDRITVEADDKENRKTRLWTTVPGFPRGLP
ncbi:tetratricopeptide repeat protein [Methylicorpusculum oleiharenae]|uniref:MxaK protein n=1 Tax=Methylicorpusculum oleiharenae TaxID=1338687 RepID=UPI00135A3E5F|nr:MxaK protein [Methylicorpusculum oleiharenae]MCD2452723.1 tetratricopeptide repeat protein [Methylicorpusculum oleiharenae]